MTEPPWVMVPLAPLKSVVDIATEDDPECRRSWYALMEGDSMLTLTVEEQIALSEYHRNRVGNLIRVFEANLRDEGEEKAMEKFCQGLLHARLLRDLLLGDFLGNTTSARLEATAPSLP